MFIPDAPAPIHPGLPSDRPFSAAQAAEVGLSSRQLSRLVSSGVLRRLFRGVVVDATVPDSLDLRCQAVRLVLPPGGVVSDRSAAWLHGAEAMPANAHVAAPEVSVVRIPDGNRMRRETVDGHLRMLQPSDVEQVQGIPVTTPLRTACDLGRLLRRDDAFAALDALLRLGRFGRDELVAQANHERFRGFRGIRQLRELAPVADGRSESPKESILRLRWIDGGLPVPELQIEVRDPQGGWVRFRGDFGIPELKLIIEYDGYDFHSSPEAQASDDRRRAWLRARGWTVIIVRDRDLYADNPWIVTVLREAYQRALLASAA